MNVYQFRDALLTCKGAMIVTISTETEPALIAPKSNPYKGITKLGEVNGVINWVYETAVNRQRVKEDKEPDFTAFPRKWGQRIKGTPLVEHKGQHYLEMKVQSARARYFLATREVPYEEVKPHLRPNGPSRQGVDNEIILRDYALEHIKAITYGQETVAIGQWPA